MSEKPFYITTTLPYVNAPLHLGHATEIIRADAVARYKRMTGYDVFFNTGTDEHGMKIYESATRAGKDVQKHVDEYAALFKETLAKFGVSDDAHYIRTTDPAHVKAAQEFWKRCDKAGYIYKKNYQAKYCVGCEEEKTDSELVDGKCPEHNREPEIISEENYFFKLTAFKDRLLEFYATRPDFVVPDYRMNELIEFVKGGLKDFSISRLKSKMPWGISVPEDSEQVMYVWFDALVNYISTLGWPNERGDFEKYWLNGTQVQYCGKNNTRFQGLMWQAMLMAAGIAPTRKIIVDGFILGDGGVKMSKTLGNTVDPLDIINDYGTDGLRYFVLREFHPFEDSGVSESKLTEWYNASLANGLGNLTSRVMKMATGNGVKFDEKVAQEVEKSQEVIAAQEEYEKGFEGFNLQQASNAVWGLISKADAVVQEREPFKKIKTDKAGARRDIAELLAYLMIIGEMLQPIIPGTAKIIVGLVKEGKMPEKPLFGRK